MAEAKPLKAAATGIEQLAATDTLPVANIPVMTATVGGAVPTPPNNTTTFLRGDGTFATPSGGSGSVATDAIWDAKGDLAVGTGADAAIRLAVGTDGGQIYADASTSTGLRWLPSVISPAQITSDQDDYTPTGWAKCQVLRIDGDNGQRAITSLAATFAGDIKTISNIGSYPVYFPSEHPDGTAANRISGSKDNILPPGKSAQIIYDGTTSRWVWLTDIPDWDNGKCILYRFRPGSITAGDWGYITLTLASGTHVATSPTSTLPGVISLTTSTSATGVAVLGIPKTITAISYFGIAHLYSSCSVFVPTLSDGTETYTINVGFGSSISSTAISPSNSLGIRYTHGVNSGKFQGYHKDGAATETTVDLGVTVAANTIYVLRSEIAKAQGEVRFYINDVYVGRVTGVTNISQVAGPRAIIVKSAGTTLRSVGVFNMIFGAVYN